MNDNDRRQLIAIDRQLARDRSHFLLFKRGKLNLALHQYQDAIQDFSECIERLTLSRTFLSRAVCYYRLSQYDRAILDIDSALEISPRSARAHHIKATILASTWHLETAIDSISHAIEHNSRPIYFYKRSHFWFFLGNVYNALRDINDAISLRDRVEYRAFRAYIQLNDENTWQSSVDDLNHCIRLSPENLYCRHLRGMVLLAGGARCILDGAMKRGDREANKILRTAYDDFAHYTSSCEPNDTHYPEVHMWEFVTGFMLRKSEGVDAFGKRTPKNSFWCQNNGAVFSIICREIADETIHEHQISNPLGGSLDCYLEITYRAIIGRILSAFVGTAENRCRDSTHPSDFEYLLSALMRKLELIT